MIIFIGWEEFYGNILCNSTKCRIPFWRWVVINSKVYLVFKISSSQIIRFPSFVNERSVNLTNRSDRHFIMGDRSGSSFLFFALLCTILVILPMLAFCWLARRQKSRRLAAAEGKLFGIHIKLDGEKQTDCSTSGQ